MLNMAKNKQASNKHNKVTTLFGYGLFIGIVLSFIFTTLIPFSSALSYPSARHFNIITILVTFAAASVLPYLVSYILGDRATHKKNKALHHYNGVLFGFASFWVGWLINAIGFDSFWRIGELAVVPFGIIITNGIPILLTVAIMTIVAVTYSRNQKNKSSVLQHLPFQVTLIGSFLGYLCFTLFNQDYSGYNLLSLLAIGILVGVTVISYKVLAKHQSTKLARWCEAIIAMSIGWIAISIAVSFVAILGLHYEITNYLSYAIGLVAWLLYLHFRTRK